MTESQSNTQTPEGSARKSWLNFGYLIAILIILNGCGLSGADDVPIDLLSQLKIQVGSSGEPVAQLDRELCRSAFEKARLPKPPDLNGDDPIVVRKLLEAYTSWVKTHESKALADMAMIFQALEEHQPALDCFLALLDLDPENTLWLYYAGVESQELGTDEAAIYFLGQSLKDDKDYAITYARLGSLYLAANDLDKAQANYELCKQYLPDQSLAYIGLGRVEMAKNNTVEAEALFRKAVSTTTNDHMAYRMLSSALSRNSKDDEARLKMQIAEKFPQYKGWLLFDSRLMDSHALAQTQSYLESQMRLSQGSNDVEKSISLGEHLLERRPGDASAIELVASGYAQLKRFDKALELVDDALKSSPGSLEMLSLRSRLLFYSNKIDEAYKILDDVIALNPKYANAYELRGSFLYQQKRFDEAKEALSVFVQLDPTASDSRLVLGIIHLQDKEYALARKYLRELLMIDPNNLTANRLLQSLPQN